MLMLWSLAVTGILFSSLALANENVALVIGNSNYKQSSLINPANDARAVAEKFEGMGYEVVLALDADRGKMESVIDDFSLRASTAAKAVVYYAGHGVQIDGRNYLVPLNVKLASRRDLRKLTELSELTDEVMQASRLGVVIVDACRDNPFVVPRRPKPLPTMARASTALIPTPYSNSWIHRNWIFSSYLARFATMLFLPPNASNVPMSTRR